MQLEVNRSIATDSHAAGFARSHTDWDTISTLCKISKHPIRSKSHTKSIDSIYQAPYKANSYEIMATCQMISIYFKKEIFRPYNTNNSHFKFTLIINKHLYR